jgi:hypothetical protein
MDLALSCKDRFSIPTIVKNLLPGVGHVVASPHELSKLMNEVLAGFEFLIAVTKAKNISLVNAIEDIHVKCILEPIVTVCVLQCVRQMLVSFDEGDYDSASRLSDLIGPRGQFFPITSMPRQRSTDHRVRASSGEEKSNFST